MREWSSVRWFLIVLSVAVAGLGFFALGRSVFVDEARRGREIGDQARLIQRNEESLKRIEALERMYKEEILPTRNRMIRNRQRLAELMGALPPELRAAALNRDRGGWPPEANSEASLAWAQFREVLLEATQDPRFWSREGSPGQGGGQAEGLKPSTSDGNGHVQ
jgi:hypothetical protein